MFAHDFAGAIPIFKKGGIGDFALELFEALAFTLDEKIKVHDVVAGGCVSRGKTPGRTTPATLS